jgi:hypothetical protein
MQSGNLLKLAQCACGEDLAGSSDIYAGEEVMIAGGMISEGKTIAEMQAEEEEGGTSGAMDEDTAAAMAKMEEMVSGWLDRCDIPHP